jgi:hypothetical protein
LRAPALTIDDDSGRRRRPSGDWAPTATGWRPLDLVDRGVDRPAPCSSLEAHRPSAEEWIPQTSATAGPASLGSSEEREVVAVTRARRRHRSTLQVVVPISIAVLIAAACSDPDAGDAPAVAAEAGPGPSTTVASVTTSTGAGEPVDDAEATGAEDDSDEDVSAGEITATAPSAASVATTAPGVAAEASPLPAGDESSTLVVLQDDPYVAAAVYPRPGYEGNPWSVWGQGRLADNGRLFTAMGDHLGQDGNTYLYAFDQDEGRLVRFADVQSIVGHTSGSWGYGKVHGQLSDAGDGSVYFATYYGSREGITFDDSYRGDVLARLDPDTLEAERVAVPVPEFGIPSLAGSRRGLLYGEAVDPMLDEGYPGGGLLVFDTARDEVVRFEEDVAHDEFRNVIVDAEGGAWFAADGGGLFHYSPDDDEVTRSDVNLGGALRASTRPDAEGVVYGVTGDPLNLFAFDPGSGEVRQLGKALDDTASVALTPDESAVLYVPGAHGDSPQWNTPLIAVDTETGEQTTLVELYGLVQREFGLSLGGTYSIVVDDERGLAYLTFNAGASVEEPWGEAVLVVVGIGDPGTAGDGPDRGGPVATDGEAGDGETAAPHPWAVDGDLVFEDGSDGSGLSAADPGVRGHAVAAGDVDEDGWTDVFLGTFADRPTEDYAQRGASGPSADLLLRGGPDGFTVDESFPGRLGRTAGATMADLDADGDLDLVVSRNVREGARADAPTEVLANSGGRFTPAAVLDDHRGGRAVGTLDYDGDGQLDILLVEDRWTGGSTALFHNEGGLRFTETTSRVGLPDQLAGLGLGIGDFDGDGDEDFFVGGDNRMYLWDDGRFVEAPSEQFAWETHGNEDDVAHVAVADVDGDDLLDLLVGQHYNSTIDFGREVPVRLYLNEGVDREGWPRFRDVTAEAGLVGLPTKAPRVLVDDLDADGYPDIVTTASVDGGSSPAVFWGEPAVDGVPHFRRPSGLGSAQYWIDAAVLDADRDRRPDLLLVEWEPRLGSRLLWGRDAG